MTASAFPGRTVRRLGHATVRDVVLWAALAVAVVAEARQQWGQVAAGVAWSGLVVIAARRWPWWALLGGTAANLCQLAELPGSRVWPVLVSATAALLAGRRMGGTLAAAAIFSSAGAAGLLLAAVSGDVWAWFSVVLPLVFFGVVPWLAGRYGRLRAMLAVAGWQRAEQLERERLLVAREARLRERTRIARDMHDSLGHDLSLIAMRAGALELDRGLAEQHRTAIGEVRSTSVEAIERLREIVGLLRDEVPVEDGIADLVARSRASGVDCELLFTGTTEAAPSPVERTAYRVVQEALTNAIKHAYGAPVTVRLEYAGTRLKVTVRNGASKAAAPRAGGGGGRGLLGLRERVRLVGGSLRTGVRGDGYEVVADLPYAGVPVPDDELSGSARRLSEVRSAARRGMAAAVVVSVAIGSVAFLILLGMRWYEVTHSFLHPATYEVLRIGQQRAAAAGDLPPQQVDGRPDVPEPSVPAGARCEYYRVTEEMFAGPIDVYRLCFAGGRLVGKTVVPGTAR